MSPPKPNPVGLFKSFLPALLVILEAFTEARAQLPPNPFKAPLYWSVYEHLYVQQEDGIANNYITESELTSNIDFVASNLQSAGYNMICMDGWGDSSVLTTNGYRASHSRNGAHDTISILPDYPVSVTPNF